MVTEESVVDLVNAGMESLARADAAELDVLVEAACKVRAPEDREELKLARDKLRALEMLLVLTRRNLRLLQHSSAAERHRLCPRETGRTEGDRCGL